MSGCVRISHVNRISRNVIANNLMYHCVSSLQFFPYILLLVAVLMYTPALFWRFSAAPLLQSDLGFIMEELDRCYNRAVTLAKRMATSGLLTPDRYSRTPEVHSNLQRKLVAVSLLQILHRRKKPVSAVVKYMTCGPLLC